MTAGLTRAVQSNCGLVPVARDRADTPVEAGWTVSLHKDFSTWSWFTTNPAGGGSGMTAGRSQQAALVRALSNVPDNTPVRVVVNDKDRGIYMRRQP